VDIQVAFGFTNYLKGLNGSGYDGIGTYTLELFNALLLQDQLKLHPFAAGRFDRLLDNQPVILTRSLQIELLSSMMNSSYSYDVRLKNIPRLNLIHATDHYIPVVRNIPLISTIMDVIPLTNPEWSKPSIARSLKYKLWRRVAKKSDHIITISQYSKEAICDEFKYKPENISVIPLGVKPALFNVLDEDIKAAVLRKFNLTDKPFFLNFGTIQPRKNVARLLEAVKQFPADIRVKFPLVIVGKYGWGCDSLMTDIERAQREGWCRWLKRVSEVELQALLQSANAMVFPSLGEGFGLPVVEAYASRAPVITSSETSLAEVSAGFAWQIDPYSVDAIYQMMRIFTMTEKSDHEERIQLAYQHAKKQTWLNCADRTYEIYRKVLG